MRDAVKTESALVLNTEAGVLLQSNGRDAPLALRNQERFGDRIAASDLDGDGQMDIATTSVAPAFSADRLAIIAGQKSEGTLFQSALGGGSIVGLAIGDIDLDEHPDLVVAETSSDDTTTLWHIEHAP